MKRWLLALGLTVLALLAEATFASAQTTTPTPLGPPRTGSVAGQIVNGTAGGSVPADLKVMLHAWDATGETFMQEAAVDPAGAYRFEAVPMQTGWTFGAMLTRDGATYFSETAEVAPETQALTLPVTIYDTTTDTTTVTVSQLHALLDVLPTELRVVELYVLSNSGDRAVVGDTALRDGRRITLEFALPEGANEISFQGEGANERLSLTPDGFAYTSPIPPGPGTGQIAISYVLPYSSGMTFAHTVRQPVEAASFIVQSTAGVKIAGEGLSSPVQQQLQTGAVVDIYSTRALQPGELFAATLTGTPSGTGEASTSAPVPWVLAVSGALAGLALIAFGIWLWRRSARPESSPEPELDEAWETALRAIAALDESHEKGEVPEAEYAARRTELQAQAKTILREREAEPLA